MKIVKKAKEIAKRVLDLRLGSKDDMAKVAKDMVQQEYEVGSLAYIIIVKIIMAIIENWLLSGEMPTDEELDEIAQS